MFANIFFAAICWVCALIVGAIAVWAYKRKDPMHFWSGSTVSPEEITDIPAYNHANGLMWAIYAIGMVLAGIVALFSILIGAILLVIVCVPGIAALILAYNHIYKKYKSTAATGKIADSVSKTPKAVIVATIAFVVVIFVLVGAMLNHGSKEPVVNVLNNRMQIKAMYGVDVNFSEITDISLIDKSMDDIGVGAKSDGYNGFDGVLKGNFTSEKLGKTLLFVQEKASPTIRIVRKGQEDIYISFRDSQKTEQLYQKLKSAVPGK